MTNQTKIIIGVLTVGAIAALYFASKNKKEKEAAAAAVAKMAASSTSTATPGINSAGAGLIEKRDWNDNLNLPKV